VLDPFCGGGVTVIEGLRLRRKVIGVDYNPMAILVSRLSVTPEPVTDFNATFAKLSSTIAAQMMAMYRTDCPVCGNKEAFAEWYEWSTRVRCPHCRRIITLATAMKPRGTNEYECPNCHEGFVRTGLTRLQETITRIKWNCRKCKHVGQKRPDRSDLRLARSFDVEFPAIVAIHSVISNDALWERYGSTDA
jgi:hypothetical protein